MLMDEGDVSSDGKTFADALNEKYGILTVEEPAPAFPTEKGSEKVVEWDVGIEKTVKKVKNPKEIVLSKYNIEMCGHLSESIKQMLMDVYFLDVGYNCFRNWMSILKLVSHLPSLRHLVISGNRQLMFPSDFSCSDVLQFKRIMAGITSIVMGDMDYTWFAVIQTCLQILTPGLEALYVFKNGIKELSVPPILCLESLILLDLSDNALIEWSQVSRLALMNSLEELNLEGNQIESIYFESLEDSGKTFMFPRLKKLNLRNNRISGWRDIAELNKLQSLEHLNVKSNPLLNEMDHPTSINLILGRIAGLKRINLEAVTSDLKREAYKYYIRKYYKDFKEDDGDWRIMHPLWTHLLEAVVGEPQAVEVPRASHVSLKFQDPEGNSFQKKLPYSTTVSTLKTLAKKMFSLDSDTDVKLVWKNPKVENFTYELEDENNSLSFYSVDNDDLILVQLN